MKKASSILLMIGAILSIVSAFTLAICAIVFVFIASQPKEAIIESINNGTTTVSGNFATVEEEADYIIILFNTLGIMFFIFAALYIVSAICAFVARKINSIGMYIVSLVFGIGNGLLIVGSILGLISTSKGTSKVEE